jgi:hypothetical protein
MRTTLLALVPLLATVPTTATTSFAPSHQIPGEEGPTAPDGRSGFGTERGAHELGRLFASPSEEDRALLEALDELVSDLLVLREMVRRDYLGRGYFRLLGTGQGDTLDDLHRCFRANEQSPMDLLTQRSPEREAFAELLLDSRFQLRAELFERFEHESHELRTGLSLLRATQEGLFDLKDGEARAVAGRLDLAAAALRAVRLDLDALRERGGEAVPGAPEPSWMAELIGATKLRSEADRLTALESLRAKVSRRMARLRDVLFWPRLEHRLVVEFDKREAFEILSAQHLERTLRYLVVPPYDEAPQKEILRMSRAERHRYALSEALRGLAADPLDEDLTYWAGVATDYLYEPREGRRWFDRYLALRGIRATEQETTKDRELTDKEQYALEKVMHAYTLPPGLGGGR